MLEEGASLCVAEEREIEQRQQDVWAIEDWTQRWLPFAYELKTKPFDKLLLNCALMLDRLPNDQQHDVLDAGALRWAASPLERNVDRRLKYLHYWADNNVTRKQPWLTRFGDMNNSRAMQMAVDELPPYKDREARMYEILETRSMDELWAGYWGEYLEERGLEAPADRAAARHDAAEPRPTTEGPGGDAQRAAEKKRAAFVASVRAQAEALDIPPEEIIRAFTGGRPRGTGGGRGR